jgi:hypothetical protein
MSDAFAKMVPLSEEQRIGALNAARMKIAGELSLPHEPMREQFAADAFLRLPPAFARSITILSIFMLIVGFLPSAMRLHAIGLEHAVKVLLDGTSSYVAALCIVFMSEIGQVIFTLGAINTRTRTGQFGMYIGAAICTAIALTGNYNAVSQHLTRWDAFAFLETFGPPVLVLLTSNILKSQALAAVTSQRTATAAFESARAAWKVENTIAQNTWQTAFDNAHTHHSWERLRANALREALRRANAKRETALRELTNEDWLALIRRELDTDQWYERTTQIAPASIALVERPAPMRLRAANALPQRTFRAGTAAGKHTQELNDTCSENADGTHTAACPVCNVQFVKPTRRSAINALVAHTRHAHRT